MCHNDDDEMQDEWKADDDKRYFIISSTKHNKGFCVPTKKSF